MSSADSADTHMNLGHTRIDRLILDQLRKRKLGCLYEDRRDAEIMRNRTVTRPPVLSNDNGAKR